MNRRNVIGSMVAAAAAAPFLKGADTEVEMWVKWWQMSKTYMMAVADAMPADKYDYVPFDTARSFGALMQHIGGAEGYYLGRFGKGAAPQPPALAGAAPAKGKGKGAAPTDTSKAATMKYMDELLDWSIGTVKKLTPADLMKTYGEGAQANSGLDLLLNALGHTFHERGYADMYLRNSKITPPAYPRFTTVQG